LIDEQSGSRDLVLLVLGRLGHRVDAAATGRAGLECLGTGAYDALLLSTTLPDLSAAEVTRRARGHPNGGAALRVLTIAPPGTDREGLLSRHLDARVERPLDFEPLLHWIQRLMPRSTPQPATDPAPEPVLDLEHLQGFTDGDRQLESELGALYLSSAGIYLEQMRDSLAKGASWRESAHALKGASSNLGARRVAALALAAEHAPPDGALLEALERAVEEVAELFAARRP